MTYACEPLDYIVRMIFILCCSLCDTWLLLYTDTPGHLLVRPTVFAVHLLTSVQTSQYRCVLVEARHKTQGVPEEGEDEDSSKKMAS